MEKEYGVRPGEASLLGMTRTRDDRWEFAIHPAIADTILARDGMRLDMLIASSPKELPKVPKFETYQWYDEEAIVSSRDGVLRVEAKTGPRDILLRLRLWGQTRPGWLKRHTFQEEFDQREEERARKAGLADTPAFRWARLRSKTLGALQADLSRGKPEWLKPDDDRWSAQRRELARRLTKEGREAGLADSPPYKLEQLPADIDRKLQEEVLAGPPRWAEAGEDVYAAQGREFARRYAESAKQAGLADSAPYRLERLRADIRNKLGEELRTGQPLWLKPGENRFAAEEREFARRYAKTVKEAGLAEAPPYKLEQLRADIEEKLQKEALDGRPSWLERGQCVYGAQRREFARRYAKAVKEAGLADAPPYKLEKLRADIDRKLQEEVLAGRPKSADAGEQVYIAQNQEFARRYAEGAKEAGLADSAVYRLEEIRAAISRKLSDEVRAAQPAWMKQAEFEFAARNQEFARRYAKAVKEAGLADAPAHKLDQLQADIDRKLQEEARGGRPKWAEPGESVSAAQSREFARRYSESAKNAGLADSADYRLQQLAEEVAREVRGELEGEIANPHRDYVANVWKV